MARLTKESVTEVFEALKSEALSCISKGNYETAVRIIEKASIWGYSFNFKYRDDTLEECLNKISIHLGQRKPLKTVKGRLAFVCSRMMDNGELVRQYTRAIIAGKIPTLMLVIYEKDLHCQELLKEIHACNNIEFHWIPSSSAYLEAAKIIADYLEAYMPEKILQHFTPWETRCLLGVSLFRDIPKYNININDHAFWIGSSFLNYSIEFRPAGCVISREKRQLSESQLRLLRFFPNTRSWGGFSRFPFRPKREGRPFFRRVLL